MKSVNGIVLVNGNPYNYSGNIDRVWYAFGKTFVTFTNLNVIRDLVTTNNIFLAEESLTGLKIYPLTAEEEKEVIDKLGIIHPKKLKKTDG